MGDSVKIKRSGGTSLSPSDFVHLHNHTHHSLLDGLTKIPALVAKVKEFGMESAAITDHGTMSGVLEFYKAAVDAEIKPILGIEAYVAARGRADREPGKDKARFHLTILAGSDRGYRNLMQLSTKANLEGMYYKPRIDHELLEEFSEGLFILSGCASGEIGERLQADDYAGAKEIANWYKSVFGDHYYLELQDHGHPDSPSHWPVQSKINDYLLKLSEELGIPAVVTCDGHYLTHEDQEAHEILLCVGTGSYLSDTNRMSLKNVELHLTAPRDIIKRWGREHPELITNTRKIADSCKVNIELGKILIPKYPVPSGETEKSYLDKLVYIGLAWRYGDVDRKTSETMTVAAAQKTLSKQILDRAAYELSIMDSMGYNGYFLIVQDFINWGKDRGIVFGPGRGSAAGSIVAYSLRITELDPLHYNLMFERFLNPSRISMPDIDIDIQDSRRDEVIQYCSDKYGSNRVANIVTFGKMAARAAVRDVARVLQVPYAEADRLSKMIPPPVQGRHIPLSKSVKNDPDLKHEYETNPTAKQVFDFAIRLEGTIRSHGVHAAGVVIAPDDLVKFVPLEMAQKGVVATQYPMNPVEELGLLKMDFLGLSNLTIINNAQRIVKKVYKETIDLSVIDMQDPKTFELLRKADTTGVFQLESAGMKRYLRELGPTQFEDIIAMVALYRPGPMAEIPRFIKGKNDPGSVEYLHESLEPILKETYGVMVYQEQIINLLQLIAGYTPGQADLIRKAIGKKKRDIMTAEEPKFIAGCLKQGLSRDNAETLWALIQPFADYSFNKAHAACYGLIAYWTAYLKAHYPDAFMAALMTSDEDNIDRLAIEINECKHMGLTVLSPDINQSFVEFAVVPDKQQIRFGMAAIKGVGVAAVEEILRAREDGEFKSIEDFARRVSTSRVNKKAWEALIKSGGFDRLGDRSDLLYNLESILGFASKLQKEALSGQTDLFGNLDQDATLRPKLELQVAPARFTEKEQLMWERELLGLYISAHPLDNFDAYFQEQSMPLGQVDAELEGQPVTVGGLITTLRTIVTKSGSKMAFVGIEDKTGEVEVIVFPNLYEKVNDKLAQDAVVKITGKISSRDREGNSTGDVKLIADNIEIVTDKELNDYQSTGQKMSVPTGKVKAERKASSKTVPVSASAPSVAIQIDKKLYVHILNPDDQDKLMALKQICSDHPGLSDIIMVLGADKQKALRLPFRVDVTETLLAELSKSLGAGCIALK